MFGNVGSSEGRSGYRYGGAQAVVGYDWRAPEWLVGAALSAEGTNLSVDGPNNSNSITTVRVGTYGATELYGLTLGSSALLTWDHHDMSRELTTFAQRSGDL